MSLSHLMMVELGRRSAGALEAASEDLECEGAVAVDIRGEV